MTPPFEIRATTPADAGAVSDLLAQSYPRLMPAGYDAATLAAALPIMTRANPALLASGTYYGAVAASGELVGCGGWTAGRPGSGAVEAGLGHVRHFATHPDWTGQGVGRTLFQHCRAEAAKAGIHRFECYASLNAEAFYRALGFAVVGPLEVDFGGGVVFPSLVMRAAFA